MSKGRPPIEDQLRAKVTAFLSVAVSESPTTQPISLRTVANAVGHDRRVLKKYRLDLDIKRAAELQRREHRSRSRGEKQSADQSLRALRDELASRTQQYQNVVALLALTEANARRLGIDPDELHRPLAIPDRTISAVFKSKYRG